MPQLRVCSLRVAMCVCLLLPSISALRHREGGQPGGRSRAFRCNGHVHFCLGWWWCAQRGACVSALRLHSPLDVLFMLPYVDLTALGALRGPGNPSDPCSDLNGLLHCRPPPDPHPLSITLSSLYMFISHLNLLPDMHLHSPRGPDSRLAECSPCRCLTSSPIPGHSAEAPAQRIHCFHYM
jgi:hypothetical protein